MTLKTIYLVLLTLVAPSIASAEGFQFSARPSPLDPRTAFVLHLVRTDEDLRLEWQIAPGYYLYRDKTEIHRINGNERTPLQPQFAAGEQTTDPEWGRQTIYRLFTVMTLPLGASHYTEETRLEVTYQGCKEGQLCYPPTTVTLEIF
jgi:thiol:disulfide interchange protein DsbD